MRKSISILKTIRQAEKRRERNKYLRTRMRGVIKRFIRAEKLEEKARLLPLVYSYIDKNVSKGILHRNTAARKKRQFALMLKKEEK